jgi:hypothetical protein
LYIQTSTIPQAGKGAFSRRFLEAGTVVTSAPLLVAFRDIMDLNSTHTNKKQLFYNYCFGHNMSSAMFFPLNQILAINHNSNRMASGKEPNARVEFSTKYRKSRYVLRRPLDELKKVSWT